MTSPMPTSVAARFSDVSIREYEVIPSDHPSVQIGVGIELGWKYNMLCEHKPIDEYEQERKKFRNPYYTQLPPPSATARHCKLREFGFTKEEITEAAKRSAAQRKQLTKSLRRMKLDRFDEMKEDFSIAVGGKKIGRLSFSRAKDSRRHVRNDSQK
mmetsp:Transcript_5520/g.10070  ORF Transcript_5520/g.10070 Transcript_5520/m.10070 type:complete len:156 (+) Transcript_5520:196-663(+)|eukprot:CAMPEP_0201606584 /NCGR_PEP_ID=MMETSP0492-20130828/5984_1 /ASSEMBLY_ACC=CAM_ASM_000837 /TAXON_ID=420259 /ORGANISM="Thalassiosira gravida, Strain GMp14c1" /LENGTH=155 /DNA_ID=CAMNT_0048071015 /DNA_START=155 /DNA_END=622 /DNA_ORIENTATION=+